MRLCIGHTYLGGNRASWSNFAIAASLKDSQIIPIRGPWDILDLFIQRMKAHQQLHSNSTQKHLDHHAVSVTCARLVLKLRSAGAQIVLGWCSNCARLVLTLCSAGAQIVLGWCSNCAQLVLKFCFSCGPSDVLHSFLIISKFALMPVLKLCLAGAQIVPGWC